MLNRPSNVQGRIHWDHNPEWVSRHAKQRRLSCQVTPSTLTCERYVVEIQLSRRRSRSKRSGKLSLNPDPEVANVVDNLCKSSLWTKTVIWAHKNSIVLQGELQDPETWLTLENGINTSKRPTKDESRCPRSLLSRLLHEVGPVVDASYVIKFLV